MEATFSPKAANARGLSTDSFESHSHFAKSRNSLEIVRMLKRDSHDGKKVSEKIAGLWDEFAISKKSFSGSMASKRSKKRRG